jgi:hypothetical protein
MNFSSRAEGCDPPAEPRPLERASWARDTGAAATFWDDGFRVDWEKAAPSWSAIWCGAILPMLGSLVAIAAICVELAR